MNMDFDRLLCRARLSWMELSTFLIIGFLAVAEWKISINIYESKIKITLPVARSAVDFYATCHSNTKSLKICFCYHLPAIRCSEKYKKMHFCAIKINFCWTNRGNRLDFIISLFTHIKHKANKLYCTLSAIILVVISQKCTLSHMKAARSSWNETEWNQNLLRITWDSNGEWWTSLSQSFSFHSHFLSPIVGVFVCVQWPYCTCFTYRSEHIGKPFCFTVHDAPLFLRSFVPRLCLL